MSLAKSVVVGSTMGKETEAEEEEGEDGGAEVAAGGGGAGVDEDRRKPDTRLSKTLVPRIGGPWLRGS